MNTSAINNHPSMQLVNAQLSGEATRANIATAVAVKRAKMDKEIAQAAIQLLDTASQIGSNQTPSRGIDMKA